jgi:RND family efflux transporter MFP subunit
VLQARGDEEVAAAELVAARRRLAQIQRTEEGEAAGVPVRAPIAGVVARVDVAPGAFVEEGARLFHLVNPQRLWLDARVAEADLGRIRTPAGAWFSVRGPGNTKGYGDGQVFTLTPQTGARLVAYGAMVDPESRTVPVIFELTPAAYPSGERLRVGQSVSARVYTGEEADTLVVPAGALVNDAGADVVYVQVAGDRFERRLVHTGLRDGDQVGVHDGVREGERVVSRGAYLVHLAAGAEGDAGHHHGHDH